MTRQLTEPQFAEAVRAVTTSIIDALESYQLDRNDMANISGAAMANVLAFSLGKPAAVDRMRDMADRCEAEYLAGDGV